MRILTGLVLFVIGVGTSAGCRVNANANVNTGGEEETQEFDEPLTESSASLDEETDDEFERFALLGARHDLTLSDAGKKLPATCSCLTVKVGMPSDRAFQWQSVVPTLDVENQVIIALSSEGHSCEGEPEDSLGASYMGYERRGDDVIIRIENARFGRPLTSGAVIPKPMEDGKIYVRPASSRVPYGRSSKKNELCRLM